jgi:hypothetical protein
MDMFNAQNARVPDKAKNKNYVSYSLTFLKHMGTAGFEEAERLQDINVESMCAKIKSFVVSHSVFNVSMVNASVVVCLCVCGCCLACLTCHIVYCQPEPTSYDYLAEDRSCFLPNKNWLFST